MNNIKANYENEDDRREIAIQIVINNALEKGTLVKGISEVLKAIELRKVKCVFLAEDCNNDKYIDIIKRKPKYLIVISVVLLIIILSMSFFENEEEIVLSNASTAGIRALETTDE